MATLRVFESPWGRQSMYLNIRALANKMLDRKIICLFDAHKGRAGSPRITKDLHDQEEKCSKNRVARRMKYLKLQAKAKKI
jgi:hypothetical protein